MSLFQNKILLVPVLFLVSMGISAQERGMGNSEAVFIEKGTRSVGLSFGFDSWELSGSDGFDFLGIILGLDGYARETDLAAQGAWFIKDNVSVGFSLGYSDTRASLDTTVLAGIELPDRHIARQVVDGSLTCRGYLPLFDGRILALFFEGRLSGTKGYWKNYKLTGNGKEGYWDEVWSASAGLYPGISVFATNNMAFEVSMPLLEGGMRRQEQDGTTTDGFMKRTFLKFKPGLTGIRMGIVYHF